MSPKNDEIKKDEDPSPRPWRIENDLIVDRDGKKVLHAPREVALRNARLVCEAVNDLHTIESIGGAGCPATPLDKARELRELWEELLGSRGTGGASQVSELGRAPEGDRLALFKITDTDGSEFVVTVRRKSKPTGPQVPDGDYKVPKTWEELR